MVKFQLENPIKRNWSKVNFEMNLTVAAKLIIGVKIQRIVVMTNLYFFSRMVTWDKVLFVRLLEQLLLTISNVTQLLLWPHWWRRGSVLAYGDRNPGIDSRHRLKFLSLLTNGEPSPPGGDTGLGWKARPFCPSQNVPSVKQNGRAFYPGPVLPPRADGSPFSAAVSAT